MYPPALTLLVCILLPLSLLGQRAAPPDSSKHIRDTTLSKKAKAFLDQNTYSVRLAGTVKDQNDSIVRKPIIKWRHVISTNQDTLKAGKADYYGRFEVAIDTDTIYPFVSFEKKGYANVILGLDLREMAQTASFDSKGDIIIMKESISTLTIPKLPLDTSSTIFARSDKDSSLLHLYPEPHFAYTPQECNTIQKDNFYILRKDPADTTVYCDEVVPGPDSSSMVVSGRWYAVDYVEVDSAFVTGAVKTGYVFGNTEEYYLRGKAPAVCSLEEGVQALATPPEGWGRSNGDEVAFDSEEYLRQLAAGQYPVYQAKWLPKAGKYVYQLRVSHEEEQKTLYVDAGLCSTSIQQKQ